LPFGYFLKGPGNFWGFVVGNFKSSKGVAVDVLDFQIWLLFTKFKHFFQNFWSPWANPAKEVPLLALLHHQGACIKKTF
jgi:hypothetical protein